MTEWIAAMYSWLDRMTEELTMPDVVAVNVNLYENPPRADLVGATHYDAVDSDWACEETFRASEWHDFAAGVFAHGCEEALTSIVAALRAYFASERPGAIRLRTGRTVTVGFVEGNLVRIWPR
jgi:hypothetical protein